MFSAFFGKALPWKKLGFEVISQQTLSKDIRMIACLFQMWIFLKYDFQPEKCFCNNFLMEANSSVDRGGLLKTTAQLNNYLIVTEK